MTDISFAEMALVLIIALIVLGPERLPKAARTMGHWVGRARAAFNHLKYELESEAINQEMREKFKNHTEELGLDQKSLAEDMGVGLMSDNKPGETLPAEKSERTASPDDRAG